jgi:purine-binding chemotaxis protein CheW
VFSVSGLLFGVEISIVREVLTTQRVTKLPNVAPHILGVYNLRGSIITLIDIRQVMKLVQTNKQELDTILLAGSKDFLISFGVEKVLDFVEVDHSKIQKPAENTPGRITSFIKGSYDDANLGLVYLIENDKLMNTEIIFKPDKY